MVTNGSPHLPREPSIGDSDVRVHSAERASQALDWLEEHRGADGRWLPDGQELVRLHAAAGGRAPVGWAAWFSPEVGYLATPPHGPGDLVPARDISPQDMALLCHVAVPMGADLWARDVESANPAVGLAGVVALRRLAVLERDLTEADAARVPGLEPLEPVRDLGALRRLLADAYAGTPDGWSGSRIAHEIQRDGFDPADIVVARSDFALGELDGAHWTMIRDDGTGEVHNLSVHPRAQGSGLATRLLAGGLARLASRGCERVILWVDEDNAPAMRLYGNGGFTTAWVDGLLKVPPA